MQIKITSVVLAIGSVGLIRMKAHRCAFSDVTAQGLAAAEATHGAGAPAASAWFCYVKIIYFCCLVCCCDSAMEEEPHQM